MLRPRVDLRIRQVVGVRLASSSESALDSWAELLERAKWASGDYSATLRESWNIRKQAATVSSRVYRGICVAWTAQNQRGYIQTGNSEKPVRVYCEAVELVGAALLQPGDCVEFRVQGMDAGNGRFKPRAVAVKLAFGEASHLWRIKTGGRSLHLG
jgi:cold shock CspA family protein